MNRYELIMDEVEECFEYVDINGYDYEFVSTTSAENITNFIINHENNLLKEFVEFAKGEFIKANYCYNDTYLDAMLEMFLEEKQ